MPSFDHFWIWKTSMLPKIQFFLWLLTHYRLHTASLLSSKNILPNVTCTICGHTIEDIIHVFTDCMPAIHVWQHFNIPLPSHDYGRWLENLCTNDDLSYHNLLLPMLIHFMFWNIWKTRNQNLFNRTNLSVNVSSITLQTTEYLHLGSHVPHLSATETILHY